MRALLLGLLVCSMFACSEELSEAIIESVDKEQKVGSATGPITYLALGDSYTAGVGVLEAERWPLQMADRLSLAAIAMSDVRIVAESGWTTADLIRGIASAEIEGTFDLVSLLIGVNNQFHGYDPALFSNEFQELLEEAIALSDGEPGRVLVLSIPDYSVTEYAYLLGLDQERIRNELATYNETIKEMTETYGAVFYDITEVSRMAAQNPELTASDGLHPSAEMYSQWVQGCYQVVIDQLTKE